MRLTLPASSLADAQASTGWLRYASPSAFYGLAGRMVPWFWGAAALLGTVGLVAGLLVAPSHFQQGDAYRIIFINVPAAWMAMIIYSTMAVLAGLGLMRNWPLATMLVAALAPTCALMTFIALWTGALWDKPVWGVWRIWDARLQSQLLLLLLCVGFLVLRAASTELRRVDRLGAVVLLMGAANVPILYLSMPSWNVLQGGVSTDAPVEPGMFTVKLGMLLMVAAFLAWSVAVGLHRVRSIILEQQIDSDWVRELPEAN